MQPVIYPGSFDPITYGHLDIIKRVCGIFDDLYIVVMNNSKKTYTFTVEERIDMIQKSTEGIGKNITVEAHGGLLVDYCRLKNTYTIARGIRAITDFDYEYQLAHINRKLNEKIEYLLFVSDIKYSCVSSSLANEIALYGGDASLLVPEYVEKKLNEKYSSGGHVL